MFFKGNRFCDFFVKQKQSSKKKGSINTANLNPSGGREEGKNIVIKKESERDAVRAKECINHRRGWLYRLPRGHPLREEVPALQGEQRNALLLGLLLLLCRRLCRCLCCFYNFFLWTATLLGRLLCVVLRQTGSIRFFTAMMMMCVSFSLFLSFSLSFFGWNTTDNLLNFTSSSSSSCSFIRSSFSISSIIAPT